MKKEDTFKATYEVTETLYDGFIKLFHDKNPLHTNSHFARSKGFRDKVMHGNILGGFVSYFVGECLPEKNVIIHKQEIGFYKPVYMNARLQFEAVIQDYFESVKTYEIRFRFINQEDEVVAKGNVQIGMI